MRYHSNVFRCDAFVSLFCKHPTYADCITLLHGWGVLVWMCNPSSEVQCLSPRSCVSCRFIKQTCKAYILLHSNPCQVARPLPPQSNQPTTFEGIFLTYSPHRPHNKLSKIALKGMARRMAYSAVHWEGGALGGLRPTTPTGCHLLV